MPQARGGRRLRPIADISLRKTGVDLVRRSVNDGKDSPLLDYFLISHGMAEYRDGRFPAAEEILRPFGPANEPGVTYGATAQCYRAMALFRLGRADEAREVFSAANARTRHPPADDVGWVAGNAGHDDLFYWLPARKPKLCSPKPGRRRSSRPLLPATRKQLPESVESPRPSATQRTTTRSRSSVPCQTAVALDCHSSRYSRKPICGEATHISATRISRFVR